MKKIYLLLLLVITASTFTFTSCNSTEDPIITAGADDFPMILDPLFPDRNGDTPGLYSTITRDQNLKITVTVTPVDYTKVEWFIDDSQVATGTELDMALLAGEYNGAFYALVADEDIAALTEDEHRDILFFAETNKLGSLPGVLGREKQLSGAADFKARIIFH